MVAAPSVRYGIIRDEDSLGIRQLSSPVWPIKTIILPLTVSIALACNRVRLAQTIYEVLIRTDFTKS